MVSILSTHWAHHHQVTIAVFRGNLPSYDVAGRVVNLGLPESDGFFAKIGTAVERCVKLTALFRSLRPDAVVSFSESANFPTIIAATIAKSLGRLRVSVRTNPGMLPVSHRLLIRSLYRFPAGVVAVSDGVRAALLRMGLPAQAVSVIPNPITIDAHTRGLPPPINRRFVLGVGRLVRQKGFDLLLAAFAMIPDEDLQLVILGDGVERSTIVRLSRTLGVNHRTHLIGQVNDVAAWYAHAACFVLSSRNEGRPNALVEAMAIGCPVVSFDCPYGPSEIIEHGRTGLLVSDGDVSGLSAAVRQVLTDRGLGDRMSTQAKDWARSFVASEIAKLWWYS